MSVCTLNVLLIDDNEGFAKPVKEALADSGHNFRVICHDRLQTGLEHLEKGSFLHIRIEILMHCPLFCSRLLPYRWLF